MQRHKEDSCWHGTPLGWCRWDYQLSANLTPQWRGLCCKTRWSTCFCCFGQCDLKELSGCFTSTSGALSVDLGLGGEKKYVGHCCPFFSLSVWSAGNCVMLKATSFSTVLVGVQDRTSSLWFSLKNNEFHKYENIMDEFFCFITIGA